MSARIGTEIIYTPYCSECEWYGEETAEELEALHDAAEHDHEVHDQPNRSEEADRG